MSRCKSCDVILNEYELKKIDHLTGHHLDLCNACAAHSNEALMDEVNKIFDSLSSNEIDSMINT
jgi:protein-arginine kinase activator protein McsA